MVATSNDIPNLPSSLFPGKGQRVVDIVPEFPEYTSSELTDALEGLVALGNAEKYVHHGETYYLKKV